MGEKGEKKAADGGGKKGEGLKKPDHKSDKKEVKKEPKQTKKPAVSSAVIQRDNKEKKDGRDQKHGNKIVPQDQKKKEGNKIVPPKKGDGGSRDKKNKNDGNGANVRQIYYKETKKIHIEKQISISNYKETKKVHIGKQISISSSMQQIQIAMK